MEILHRHSEIIHIFAGPIVGIVITVLAFSDDFFIKRKLKQFFKGRGVEEDVAKQIEAIVSGGIALGTFWGNVYLLFWNLAVAVSIFPHPIDGLALIIWELVLLVYGIRAVYVYYEYELVDLGEIEIDTHILARKILLDQFLRLEQVGLNVFTTSYFVLGVFLERWLGSGGEVVG
jgi:hypothetical protein